MSARPTPILRGAAVMLVLGAAGAVGLLTPSCSNPVQDVEIAALGAETPGVPTGPFHRPGQPCIVCHSKYGGKTPEMVIAGTVFADLNSLKPVANVDVVLTDAVGETRTATSNCIGNFYISTASWNARFPLAAEIRFPVYNTDGTIQKDGAGNEVRKVKAMGSVISRNGSCSSCHQLSGRKPKTDAMGNILDYDSTGWIYCNAAGDTNFFPDVPSTCQGKPPTQPSTSTSSSSSSSTGAGG